MESPETWQDVAAIVAGAGLTGTVQGLVKSVLPQVSAEIGGAVAGGLMIYFGDRVHWVVRALGVGILAGSLAPMIARFIPQLGAAPAAAGAAPTVPTVPIVAPTVPAVQPVVKAPAAATAASAAAATYVAAKKVVALPAWRK